jgi:hypothetical protein
MGGSLRYAFRADFVEQRVIRNSGGMVEEPNAARAARGPFETKQAIEKAALAGQAAASLMPALAELRNFGDSPILSP